VPTTKKNENGTICIVIRIVGKIRLGRLPTIDSIRKSRKIGKFKNEEKEQEEKTMKNIQLIKTLRLGSKSNTASLGTL
jgi:hypothetical protein